MGSSKEAKAVTHERILSIAARRFRERGLEGIGIADIMKEAGLTVGGFYKHFESRDALVVEAVAHAMGELCLWEGAAESLEDLIGRYLNEEHRDLPGEGCAFGCLTGDLGRAHPQAQALATERLNRSLAFISKFYPDDGSPQYRAHAITLFSTLVGAIGLSRAVSDEALSREILQSVAAQMLSSLPAKSAR